IEPCTKPLKKEIQQVRAELDKANEENKRLRETWRDVRAKVREIKYHHRGRTMTTLADAGKGSHLLRLPLAKTHGKTSRICEDIENRIKQALKEVKP
ncbi:hypothetical protein LCGC14_1999270, partial [marine sediment metagenome]